MAGTRADLIKWMDWAVSRAPGIHYSEHRPMPLACPPRIPLYSDCSSTLTILAHCAGLPDPNGLGYTGQGYTGTMWAHMPHIPRADALPGDFGTYRRGAATVHVIALYKPGSRPDPIVFSHGSEVGPLKLRLSSESAAHAGQSLTFTRLEVDDMDEAQVIRIIQKQVPAMMVGLINGAEVFVAGKPQPGADTAMAHQGWALAKVIRGGLTGGKGGALTTAQVKQIITASRIVPPA